MRLIQSWIIMLLIGSLSLSGCGKTPEEPKSKPAKPMYTAIAGQLGFGSKYEPDTLNPYLSNLIATAEACRFIFSGLLIMDNHGQWNSDLALDVPTLANGGISADGLAITYKLRRNVVWHDEAPFTANDVVFTYKMIMGLRDKGYVLDGYDKIASVMSQDSYTVVVRFREKYAQFHALFPYIMPEHILAKSVDIKKDVFNRSPVGTGPFVFKKWTVAEAMMLEANPKYFRGKPNLDSVVFKFIPDEKIMMAQLKANQIHIASNLSVDEIEKVKAIGSAKVDISPSLLWEQLSLNLDNESLKDVRVRQAIRLTIDRKVIVQKVLRNNAFVAWTDQWFYSWANNPERKEPTRDLEEAHRLLTEAGWKTGEDGILAKNGKQLSFSMAITNGNVLRSAVAKELERQLREVGIQIEVKQYDNKTYFEDILRYRRFDVALFAWVSGIDPDNSVLWNSRFIPGPNNGYAGRNYVGLRDVRIDSFTQQGMQTVDVEQRKPVYFALQDLIATESPAVPLYYHPSLHATALTVDNFKPNPSIYSCVWNAYEWALNWQ